LIIQSEPLV